MAASTFLNENMNPFNLKYLDQANQTIRALAHALRLDILSYIDQHPGTNVNSIYNALELEQSITSQHLRILRQAELVNCVREGKQILYSLNYPRLHSLQSAIQEFLK
ncbi:ArsR/SmtB family transcription factor [Saprospira grandis]|uniref:ArsR/SmtB family transcription factor n=1 Tax=Saprospira grandis TaxID=1008 RepID=UPI0022DE346B|nr:metalloregulator ArsR/SmtB family transcription factor [Saprospira grandis]WBM75675.1 metalloregulator ArsR/SmtB family transcription factor [Saprospira grandis]